jgi:hypothetical protein
VIDEETTTFTLRFYSSIVFFVVAEVREETGPGPGDDLQDPEGQVYFHTQTHLKGQCHEIQIKKIFNQKKNIKKCLNTFEK